MSSTTILYNLPIFYGIFFAKMKYLLLTELTVVENMLFLLAVHSLMVELTANVAKA